MGLIIYINLIYVEKQANGEIAVDDKQTLIRFRPETKALLKEYCDKNRRSMASFVDQLVYNELKQMADETDRLEAAQRHAGSIT